jgi:hypothetical protein
MGKYKLNPTTSELDMVGEAAQGVITPAAHKATHAVGGNDALSPADIGAVGTSDSRLSDSREWSAPTVTEAEATQGTSTERRAWPPVRVFQAIASWWNGSSDKTKLDGIQEGAQANVATNLSYDAVSREVRSSTGDDATLPLASTTAAGLAPATGTPTGNYLKDDLTWAPVSAAPGGSSGQVQINNGGAFGGLSTLTADGSGNLTLSARLINAFSAAASAPAKLFSGNWFTGGTSTTTKPHLLIEPAGTTSTNWNTAGTGFGVNAPSGFAGDLAWFGVGGVRQGVIKSDGSSQFGRFGALSYSNGFIVTTDLSGVAYSGYWGSDKLQVHPSMAIAWGSAQGYDGATLALYRDAANTLAQRNGTNAQTSWIFNTFTSSTNFERAKVEWASNILRFGTEKGSAGGTARDMELQTDGTTRITLKANGAILFSGVPTTNPNVAGQLWNDGGTLKISA